MEKPEYKRLLHLLPEDHHFDPPEYSDSTQTNPPLPTLTNAVTKLNST